MNFITKKSGNPKVLSNTISSVLQPTVTATSETAAHTCEDFQRFFTGKMNSIRERLLLPSPEPSEPPTCSSFLTYFKPVSLSHLTDIVMHMTLALWMCYLHHFSEKTVVITFLTSFVSSSVWNGTVPLLNKLLVWTRQFCHFQILFWIHSVWLQSNTVCSTEGAQCFQLL